VEASGLLSFGGASAVAVVAVARWRPSLGRTRVRREPISLDLVELALREEDAMDGDEMGDASMTQMPMMTNMPNPMAGNGNAGPNGASPTGLPSEQLYTWLEWVQDDLRRVETRLEFLEAARQKLREQERLLGELLAASSPIA
jgi:hypothetical protein